MLVLSCPVNQDYLNAAVFDVIHLNVDGVVCIIGSGWDCYDTLGYLEKRMKCVMIATQCSDGSEFCVCGRTVSFTTEGVLIYKTCTR
jgi:hypothetical protein